MMDEWMGRWMDNGWVSGWVDGCSAFPNVAQESPSSCQGALCEGRGEVGLVWLK